MEDLTEQIKRYYTSFKKECTCKDRCWCERRAIIWAHIDATIPDEYRRFTIDDFTGLAKQKDGTKKRLLPEKIVASAKQQIINYCWYGIADGEEYVTSSWLKRTMLEKRFASNHSLVIYGAKWVTDKEEVRGKPFQKPFGRTMVAAIVMKEVIFLRWLEGHLGDMYEWVDFTTLINRLILQAEGHVEFDKAIACYRDADWLCVDNISTLERGSEAQKNYRSSVLDRLFCERREEGKPNILIFQDNIGKIDDLQGEFGHEIGRIVTSNKSFKVALIG